MAESAPDLDLRSVRYFTVVAEHRHFGRAAEALHLTQPSLSRQIRGLERRLGVPLLDRTPHGTRLTEAGEVFLPRARALLRSSAQAVAATRATARPSRIAVGHTLHVPVMPAVRDLRHRHPDAEVRVVQLAWNEPRAALLDRRVDVVVSRLPLRDDGLDVTVLYDEPRVLLVSRDHHLAGKEQVTLDDIGDEALPRLPDRTWNAYWRIDPRPDGSLAPDGPLVEAPEEKFEIVAAGQAVVIVSAGLRAETLHPGLTSIPLEGVKPGQVVLATRAGDDNPLLAPFIEAALNLLTGG
ncbi:LysR family transcriptional regulator [Nonomuraea sp. B5E05]|uniref:LysR family transcriptional regulator n=1 Tax=Nonomuraea sp. B5E05 TaxID=3153569 RepID=UPI0032610BDA